MARGIGGFAADYYGIFYHGVASTHIDALCHTWDEQPCGTAAIPEGDHLRRRHVRLHRALEGGIITRGVLLDVPATAASRSWTHDGPVHGWELEDILRATRNLTLEPGDAVVVYSGRDAWQAARPHPPYSKAVAAAPCSGRGSTSPACRSCATMT